MVQPRIFVDHGHLGFSNFAGKYPAHAFAAGMYVQHHLRGLFQPHRKILNQYVHYEVHRGVIVVQQQHGIKRRTRQRRFRRCHRHAVFMLMLRIFRNLSHPPIIRILPCIDAYGFSRDNAPMRIEQPKLSESAVWQPDVTVATIVMRDGRLLCVEEQAQGQTVINQPAGHLEPNESLQEAALRETREETGWEVRLTHVVGAYQWKAPVAPDGSGGRHYLRFTFAAEPIAPIPGATLDEGIVQALWLTPEELQAEAARHRSPLVWKVVSDYLDGCRYPLSFAQQLR